MSCWYCRLDAYPWLGHHFQLLKPLYARKDRDIIDDDSDSEELLQQVADGSIAYTVADSNRLALQRRRHPNLAVALTLQENMPMAWALPLNQDDSVKAALIEYFGTVHQSGWFTVLEDKYFVPSFYR